MELDMTLAINSQPAVCADGCELSAKAYLASAAASMFWPLLLYKLVGQWSEALSAHPLLPRPFP